MRPLDDDVLRTTWAEYQTTGQNQTATAANLGISRSTLQHRLTQATMRGLDTYVSGPALPHGLAVQRVTTLFKDDNGKVMQWVRAAVPHVKGLPDPTPIMVEAFEEFKGKALDPLPPGDWPPNTLMVYPIADLHLGMYSWKEETGSDYDVDLAVQTFTDAITDLIHRSPVAETAIILNLGDFFHSDNNENRTLRSGNALDVDTRYARVLREGVAVLVHATHLALQKHARVIIRNIPGNHDPYGTLALTLALQAYYHDHPRVKVDASPSPFFFYQHGEVLIGAAHGDMAKPQQMVNIMAAKEARLWGDTQFRYVYLGHIHRRSSGRAEQSGEFGGAVWETFQTLAPRDAWGNSMGFTAGRSLQAIELDWNKGEVSRLTAPIASVKP